MAGMAEAMAMAMAMVRAMTRRRRRRLGSTKGRPDLPHIANLGEDDEVRG